MFHDFLDLLYPRTCPACDKPLLRHEEVICTLCVHSLPVTDFHDQENNPVEQIFFGRIPVENATSLLLFEKKGIVQNLIHNLKYRGHEEIGQFLGHWLGSELKQSKRYSGITAVIPVPLHKSKLKKRGFNQVTKFGQEIATALQVPYVDSVLLKTTTSQTQTTKKRFARWGNLEESFVLKNPGEIQNGHVLLVDDLVTTGATLEACVHQLLQIPNLKISIATMAFTH